MRIFLYLFILLTTFSFAQKNTTKSIGFIENKGQIVNQKGKENKSVHYLLNTPGLNVQLRKNGFSYDVYQTKNIPLKEKNSSQNNYKPIFKDKENLPEYNTEYFYHRIDIDFANSNPAVKLIAEEKSSDYDNYYNVSHAPEGITNVHKFQKVTYLNIYNNIDVVFYIPKDSTKVVEYNFIVKPGGKISDIQLKINGAKTELANNKIKMDLRFGKMEETIPLSWVEENHVKKEVVINYRKIKKNIYGFEGEAVFDKAIVIDPTPVRLWGTYYGGTGNDYAGAITLDQNDNVLISGGSHSMTNIATSGTYQEQYILGMSGYISKFNPNGDRLWGSYFQVPAQEFKTDFNNNIVIAGYTFYEIQGITSPNCHQPVKNRYTDGFIMRLNAAGFKEWGTYYGGEGNDYLYSMTIDQSNNIYICGESDSNSGITTSGSFQQNRNSDNNNSYNDAYIVKFDTSGTRQWGTYYGGSGIDGFITSEYNTNDGFLYFLGGSNSQTNISTPNSYQVTNLGGRDCIIVKFDTNGQRVWGTYIGGENNEYTSFCKIKNNALFFVGKTTSRTNIGTNNTFLENFPLPSNSPLYIESPYVMKFDLVTQQKVWGTYFHEVIYDIDINNNNEVYFSGQTNLDSGIATPNSYKPIKNDLDDIYLVKLNQNGQREWGTYYGGETHDFFGHLEIDRNNDIYLFGQTMGSLTGIATSNSHQPIHGGSYDAFLVKFRDCQSAAFANSNSPVCIGQNLQLTASGGTNYSWTGPNGFTSNQQNPVIINANATHSGQYNCAITGTGGCDNTVSINVIVGDSQAPIPNIANLPTINGDCNTIITTIPTATDNCSGNITATTTNPIVYSLPGTYTITWNYIDGNGNTATQNQTVVISSTALPSSSSSQQFCIQQNATLNNITITGQNIKWYDASTGGNLLTNTTLLQNGVTYYASQTINGCESNRIPVTITIQNTVAPTGNANQSFCSSQNATLNDIVVSGSNITWYSTLNGTTIIPSTALLTNNTTYYATQTINGCESPTRFSVAINLINTLNATNYTETLCDNLNNGTETVNLSNYNTQLISSTSGASFSYYTTYNGAENQIASDKINDYQNFQLSVETKIIYVRIDSTNGCHQIVELKLTVVKKPVISISDIMPICEGSSITVDAGTGFDNYSWSTGSTTSSISISTPGNYSVSVSKNHGTIVCTSVKNFSVVKSNKATISEIITSDWTFNQNTITVLLTANSVGDYVYSIDGTNYQTSNTFTGLENGEYTVFIKDKNGCGIQPEDFYLLMYPKFFTPNTDSYNDYWKIKFSENEPNLTVKIFDRYGKFIKEFGANDIGWDGTLNGQAMPATDYWFVVKRQNGKEYRGHFSLKR